MLAAWMTTAKHTSSPMPYIWARQVDREAAQLIVEAAEARVIGIEQAIEALKLLLPGPSNILSSLR